MAHVTTLAEAFEATLKDIYYAENAILKALPKIIDKAGAPALKQALESHRQETQGQVQHLEHVFQSIGVKPSGEKCKAIEGILAEGEEHMGHATQPALDAIIVASSQAVEHYEITRYGTLIAWADELGYRQASQMLQQVLQQEKSADQKLTALAEAQINDRAQGGAQGGRQMAAQGGQGGQTY